MKRLLTTISCLFLGAAFTGAAQAAAPPQIAPQQELVALLHAATIRASPDGAIEETVAADRPITRERTVLPVLSAVIDNSVDAQGQLWLRVRLPGRVLGQKTPPETGWISSSSTLISTTAWHLVVDLGARRVLVYDAGLRVRSYAAVVGKSSTPTPTGEENVQMASGAPGAPFALATSDRSTVLHEFEGGPGQIAIHGIENLGGTLGTAESHGCIRLATSAITWIAARVGPGVPITIF
jgi:lipoprotein-anchoring transpeptidase ErfK/SrfK